MLKSLYDYAVRNQLTLPAGMVKKTVKAYVSLSMDGSFIGIWHGSNDPIPCPDIGALAQGPEKSNVIVEKRSVVFPSESTKKCQFFWNAMEDAANDLPEVKACLRAMKDEACRSAIIAELDREKVKPSDRVSFRVNGHPLPELPGINDWWQGFRRQFFSEDGQMSLCLITGEPTLPAATLPPIQGLLSVGGHGRGDALFCFDKDSFCSFGLKQSANAPVSAEAFNAVKAALDHLMSDRNLAPALAGMRFVHWYDRPVTEDPVNTVLNGSPGESEDVSEDEIDDAPASISQDTEPDPDLHRELPAKMIQGIEEGTSSEMNDSFSYYILLLSGVNGRVMIRSYDHGRYEDLKRHIDQWHADLQLFNGRGTGPVKVRKLVAMLIRLLSRQKADRKSFERLEKELSGTTPAILKAILTGGCLPDSVAVRALNYIRSQMIDVDDTATAPPIPDTICCQWLKAWLLRKHNQREELVMDTMYNKDIANTAYHCGAWVAIYADMQRVAMPKVNAGIVQRYYASASQMPALVIGQLASRSVPHQEKIHSKFLNEMYTQLLDSTTAAIGSSIPSILNLEQQSYFALGYRQMSAEINRLKAEHKAEIDAQQKNEEE